MSKVAKKKIATIAKKYEVPSEFIIDLLKQKGVEVRSSLSTIDSDTFATIKDAVISERDALNASGAKKVVSKSKDEDGGKTVIKKTLPFGGKVTLKKATLRKGKKDLPLLKKMEQSTTAVKEEVEEPIEEPQVQDVAEVAPVAEVQEVENTPVQEEVNAEPEVVESKPEVTEEPVVEKAAPAVEEPIAEESPVAESKPEVTEEPVVEEEKVAGKAVPAEPNTPAESSFKVKVEKPTDEMLARIAKYKQGGDNNKGRRGKKSDDSLGYTGKLGKSAQKNEQGGKGQKPQGQQNKNRNNRDNANNASGAPAAEKQQRNAAPIDIAASQQAAAKSGSTNTKGRGKKKKDKGKKDTKNQEEQMIEVKQNINRVMASLSKGSTRKKYSKEDSADLESDEEKKILKVSDFITVGELAGIMEEMPAKVIAKCMELGMMVTINFRLDFETISLLADEFGFTAELMEEYEEEIFQTEEHAEESLQLRPPVITVMGHVDHGKTSLLDYIRDKKVAAGEAGGITQHIGAYEVSTNEGKVTFLDTPGHEAFTAMRARGSQVTDVVVLIVAADSRVMPQTVESIEHARAANVPIVVAINKVDLPTANPDKIRAQLAERGIEVEEWGGNVSCVEISAKTGMGIDKLLEILALESEVLELRANPDCMARGTIVESQLDKGKGSVATVLVQEGTLRKGSCFVAGVYAGKVRAILNERGEDRDDAGPSTPCQVLGFEGTPQSGDSLIVVENEKVAREIAAKRRMAAKERELRSRKNISLEQIFDKAKEGELSEVNVIIKADVDGSVEAIASSLEKLTNKEVRINIIRKAVGNLNETDVMLAAASNAIIVAFHILPSPPIRDLAEKEGVEIKNYRIIYEIVEEFEGIIEGKLKPMVKEKLLGEAKILKVFKISSIGNIAGCFVDQGVVERDAQLRIYRNGIEIGTAEVNTLKRVKEDVNSVKAGFECGIGLSGFDDIQEDDILAFFKEIEIKRTLKDLENESKDG